MSTLRKLLSWFLCVQSLVFATKLIDAQECPTCADYELYSVAELAVPHSDYVLTNNPTCPPAVRSEVAQVESFLNGAAVTNGDYAALNDSLRQREQIDSFAPLPQTENSANEARCQNFFVVVPTGSVVTRVVLSARDQQRQGVCADDRSPAGNQSSWRDCGIGWSGFEGPIIQGLANGILVYGTFLNWSSDRIREAVMQVTYRPPKDYRPQPQAALPVEVFYATSRNKLPGPDAHFGTERGQAIDVGKCMVTIPPNHRKGQLESPTWWKLEFSQNPALDVVLQNTIRLSNEDFYSALRADSSSGAALVFIHGFGTTFEDAVRHSAQIKYDLSFPGPVIAFSWPSQGVISPAVYPVDTQNADWTVPFLAEFLRSLSTQLGNTKIVVIAHSMGSRVLMNTLIRLKGQAGIPANLSKIILAAPDVDSDVFVDDVKQLQESMTMYASSHDEALSVSRGINGHQRAGDTSKGITTVDGVVDTIDVSNVDTSLIGHFYYGDNRSVISDMYYLIRDIPMPRFGLKKQFFKSHPYWLFQP